MRFWSAVPRSPRSSRGLGAGLGRIFLGGRGVAETVIKNSGRQAASALRTDLETVAGPTDVMSTYPEDDEFEPTVALVEDAAEEPRLRTSMRSSTIFESDLAEC